MPKSHNQPSEDRPHFSGFERPAANFFRLPNNWTDISADINNIAELKVVEYILRHTWGYQEYGIKKRITIDEFMHGRRRQDGSRLDKGTGLSEMSVRNGLQKALVNGLIEEEIDDSDRGRVKKYYSVRMREGEDLGVQSLDPWVQSLDPRVQDLEDRGLKARPRTEKETLERNLRKEIYPSNLRRVETEESDYVDRADDDTNPTMPHHRQSAPLNRPGSSTLSKPAGREKKHNSKQGSAQSGFVSLGDMLAEQLVPLASSDTEDYEAIESYIRDTAPKLHDEAPLKTSTTRAYNLYTRSGVDLSRFFNLMYDAEKEAQRRRGSIKKRSADGFTNAMGYFFTILEERLGLRNNHTPAAPVGT